MLPTVASAAPIPKHRKPCRPGQALTGSKAAT